MKIRACDARAAPSPMTIPPFICMPATTGLPKQPRAAAPHCLPALPLRVCSWAPLLPSCLTPCDPRDCSPSGSSVHGILQARVLEWVAVSSSGDLPQPEIEPASPALQGDSLPLNHGEYSCLNKLSPCFLNTLASPTNSFTRKKQP